MSILLPFFFDFSSSRDIITNPVDFFLKTMKIRKLNWILGRLEYSLKYFVCALSFPQNIILLLKSKIAIVIQDNTRPKNTLRQHDPSLSCFVGNRHVCVPY